MYHAKSTSVFNMFDEQQCCYLDEAKYGAALGSTSRRVFGLASVAATSAVGSLTTSGCSPLRPQPSSDPQQSLQGPAGLPDDSSPAPPDHFCRAVTTVHASTKLRVNCGSRQDDDYNDTTFETEYEQLFERAKHDELTPNFQCSL